MSLLNSHTLNYHKEDQHLAEPVVAHVSNRDYESDGMDDTVDPEPDNIPQVDGPDDVPWLDHEQQSKSTKIKFISHIGKSKPC